MKLSLHRKEGGTGSPIGFDLANIWLALLLVLSLLPIFGGCRRDETKVARAEPPVPVRVAVVEAREVPRNLQALGTVQALRSVGVKSQVDGVIDKIHFAEGESVQTGDLLVTLDQRPFKNSLDMASAELLNARAVATQAEADLDRYQGLLQQEAVSKEQYSQIATNVDKARATVQSRAAAAANAELQLQYTEIRAPIDGRTGQLNLHEGALVKANDASVAIVSINQLSPIAVAFAVPETQLDAVREALQQGPIEVTVVGRNESSQPVVGRLDFFDNAADPTTGTILLKAVFDNPQNALWPGRFVDVTMNLGGDAQQLVVPITAVQIGQQGVQAYVVTASQTVELRKITVGRTFGDNIVVASGLKAGETVVSDGQLRLVDGSRIEVRPGTAEAREKGHP